MCGPVASSAVFVKDPGEDCALWKQLAAATPFSLEREEKGDRYVPTAHQAITKISLFQESSAFFIKKNADVLFFLRSITDLCGKFRSLKLELTSATDLLIYFCRICKKRDSQNIIRERDLVMYLK